VARPAFFPCLEGCLQISFLGIPHALGNNFQATLYKTFPAKVALDLSACRLGKTGGLDEDNSVCLDFMLSRYTLPNSSDHRVCVKFSDVSPFHLLDHHQPFLAPDFNGKRSPAVCPQCLMASLRGPLDVLRIVIAAPYDDEILEAAGDKELAGMHKPEVSRAQKGTSAIIG